MPVPLNPVPLPPGAARAHGTPLLRVATPITPTPGNIATGAAMTRTSAITKRSDAVTRASFTSPAFVDAHRAVSSALTSLPTPVPSRTSSAPLSATASAHARAAHARAARARAARADSVRVAVVSDRPGVSSSSLPADPPTLRLADLAPAVVRQLPEVEGIAWYRLRADGGRVTRVSVPASDVVDAMRVRIRALEGKVIKLEDAIEKQAQELTRRGQTAEGEISQRFEHSVLGETALRRKKSACSVGGGVIANSGGGDRRRSRGRGRSSLGGASSVKDSHVDRGHGGKRRSVGGLLEGGGIGARGQGIRSVFGGRRTRLNAKEDAGSSTCSDSSQLLHGLGEASGAEWHSGAPGRVEIGSSDVSGWGDNYPQPGRSSSGRNKHSAKRPPSAVPNSALDRPSRACSDSLPLGCTVWDATATSPHTGISSTDSEVRVRKGERGTASGAADVVQRGSRKPEHAHHSDSHEDNHDIDRTSEAAASLDGVGSAARGGPSYVSVMSLNSGTAISCPVWEDHSEGGIFRRLGVPDEADAPFLTTRETTDATNLASSSVSSDSGEPGGRLQRNDAKLAPADDLPDAPDAPNVILPSPRGYKNVKLISVPRPSAKGGGAKFRELRFKSDSLRWSNKLRRAGSGHY